MLAPRFGGLREQRDRIELLRNWLPSEFFRLSGLDRAEFEAQVLRECRNSGQFLRLLMDGIAQKQGMHRWAECTPTNALYLPAIKREIPEALFVHIIRDGRDVALSLEQQGWIRQFPWNKNRNVFTCGSYWKWMVEWARRDSKDVAGDYLEIRFEDLNERPRETLRLIGEFIQHELDYGRILQNGIRTVKRPNTSFTADRNGPHFSPVGRWKTGFTQTELRKFEGLFGAFLEELGYPLGNPAKGLHMSLSLSAMRSACEFWYSTKQWVKSHTFLSRYLTNVDLLHDFKAHDRDRLAAKGAR